jgi:hypothetical protein
MMELLPALRTWHISTYHRDRRGKRKSKKEQFIFSADLFLCCIDKCGAEVRTSQLGYRASSKNFHQVVICTDPLPKALLFMAMPTKHTHIHTHKEMHTHKHIRSHSWLQEDEVRQR